jgi:hypothetical protein
MPGPTLNEAEIRSLARQRIEDSILPVMLVTALDAGYGTEKACSVCGQTIERGQVEYEVPSPRKGTLAFHLTCFAHWQLECANWVRKGRI